MNTANREFLELMSAAGWSQAEAARQLEITSGGVSQIARGHVTPSPVTLRLLRLLVRGSAASGTGPAVVPPYATDLITALDEIEPAMRTIVIDTALQLARAYKKRPSNQPPARESEPFRYTEPVRNDVRLNTEPPPYRVSSATRRPAPSSAGMEGDALAGAVAAGQGQGAARPPRSSTASPSGSTPEPGPRSHPPSSRAAQAPKPAPPSPGNRGATAANRKAASSLKDSRLHATASGKTSAGDQ